MKIAMCFLLIFILSSNTLIAQDSKQAEKLVQEGIALEDSGKSDQAMSKYQQALDIDKNNIAALAEMAFSLESLQKYDEAILYCKTAIKTHPDDEKLATVYVLYGTAYDKLNNPGKSVKIYNEGIKQFPNYYSLYYNKGITLVGIPKLEESLECFEKSISLKPDHPRSNLAIGSVCTKLNKVIPAMMAYCRLISIEPGSDRSKEALENIQILMSRNIKKTGENNVTIQISEDMFNVDNKKQKTDDFSSVELALTMTSALDYDSAMKGKKPVESFLRKFDIVCSTLKETRSVNKGFFWDYYAPYFIEMKDKNLTTTFFYLAFSSTGTSDVKEWLDQHKSETEAFSKWSADFQWR